MARPTYTGQGGKSLNDRELAAEVRTLTLLECKKALKQRKGRLYEAVLLRLAAGVLPRLNEVSGPEGKPIPLSNVFLENVRNNDSDKKDSETEE